MASPSRIPALRHNNPAVARSPASYTPRSSPGKENRIRPAEIAPKDMIPAFSPSSMTAENNKSGREAFLTHGRRTSIPKSPRKVFNPLPSSNVPTLAVPVAQPGLGRGVPNSGSVCIPASAQTGPCLLMPTPSFSAFHKAESDSEVERKVKRGRRQGMGWLKPHPRGHPAPARESLMLATPSFVALNASNSTTSFASRYSLWHRKRGKGRADTGAAVSDAHAVARPDPSGIQSPEATIPPTAERDPNPPREAADVFSPSLAVSVFRSQDEPASIGLPKDMLDTLNELEAVAEEIKKLSTLDIPERLQKETTAPVSTTFNESDEPTSDQRCLQKGLSFNEVSIPGPANSCASKLPRTGRVDLGHAVSSPSDRTPMKSAIPSVPRRAFSEQAQKPMRNIVSTPPPVKTIPKSPGNAPSKIAVPTPKAQVGPTTRLKTVPGTAVRTTAAMTRKPSVRSSAVIGNSAIMANPSAAPRVVSKPPHVPKTSGLGLRASKLRTAMKPRHSEPVAVTTSALKKVSPAAPISRIARKARHSALPRAG